VGIHYQGAFVCARRWFDGTNTYHSVRICFEDGTEKVEPFVYGYGNHFYVTVGEMLGLEQTSLPGNWRWQEEHRVRFDVVDVEEREDLHNGGRDE
jgi:hypothetical protein